MEPQPTETRFDSYAGYRAAIADLVAGARSEIQIFDTDFSQTGLESIAGNEALAGFLGRDRGNRIRIAVHSTEFLETRCPRLRRLFAVFNHVIAIRQTPDDLHDLKECFAIADDASLVVRFHSDHPRGKVVTGDPAEIEAWRRRFAAIWEPSEESIAVTRLGL
jgi:hypothetical protein